MAKVEKNQTYNVTIDRCFEELSELLSNLGVRVESSDANSRTIAGSFKGATSKTDPTERDLPLKCECIVINPDSTEVRLTYRNSGQLNRFVSPDVTTKMESIFATLNQSLSGRQSYSSEKAAQPNLAAPRSADEQTMPSMAEYANRLYKSGLSDTQIESQLIQKGLDLQTVGIIMKSQSELRAKATRATGERNMLIGALLFLGGIIVTVVTFAAAVGSGGRYVVAWGAIIFGAGLFVRGLQQKQGKLGK